MKKIDEHILNRNNIKLGATMYLPHNIEVRFYSIFINCFTCSKDLYATTFICEQLIKQGYGVLSFDFTGLGSSEGEFKNSYFSNNVTDVEDVYTFLKGKYKAPVLIIGHSLGGLAAIVSAYNLSEIKAIATIGAPASLSHVAKYFSHGIEAVKEKGEVEIDIGGRPFKINASFINDFSNMEILPIVKLLGKPILILHSPIDTVVEVENAELLFSHARFPKNFITLDNANHLLDREDAKYVGECIADWAKRYISGHEILADTNAMEGNEVVAHLDLKHYNFKTLVETKKHSYFVDEPGKLGGDASAPAPYDYLLGALAACTAMTIKVYAERSKWKLSEVNVSASHKKNYGNDIENKGHVEYILKRIHIEGRIQEEQKQRLIHISSTCPIHKTLENLVKIETETI